MKSTVLHQKFCIGSANQEFHDDLTFLVREWPWPATKEEIVSQLVHDEAKKIAAILRAVAGHAVKKRMGRTGK